MARIYDCIVVGAPGIQGKEIAKCLLLDGYSVVLAGKDAYGLDHLMGHRNAVFTSIDLRSKRNGLNVLTSHKARVLVNAALEDYNLLLTELALQLGMHYVDLGSEEDMYLQQVALSPSYAARGLTGITAMGSTPGITNVMLCYLKPRFDTIHTVNCGFAWKSNMEVFVPPFSIDSIDVEFTRPAEVLEQGQRVERYPGEASLDIEYMGIGKQRTRYTRHAEYLTFSEYLKDMGIQNIGVYSSFPPHSQRILQIMIDLGLTSKIPLCVDGHNIKPMDLVEEVVRHIPMPEGYEELEDIWLMAHGKKDGKNLSHRMDCLSATLPGWKSAACNIDTDFPVAITAEMILRGEIEKRGFFAPEFVVPPESFFKHLGEKQLPVFLDGHQIN